MVEKLTGQMDGMKNSNSKYNHFLENIKLQLFLSIITFMFFVYISVFSLIKSFENISLDLVINSITGIYITYICVYLIKSKSHLNLIFPVIVISSLILNFLFYGNFNESTITFFIIPFISIWLFDKKIGSAISIIPLLIIFSLDRILPDLIQEYSEVKYLIVTYNVVFLISLFIDKILVINKDTGVVIAENFTSNRQLLRTLINSLPDMIYIKDKEGKYQKINESLAQFFKIEDIEIAIGKDEYSFLNEEIAGLIGEGDSNVLETGNVIWDKIYSVHNESGGLNYFSCTKAPVKNEKDEIIGVIGIIKDISEQVEIENEIGRYIEELQINRDQSEEAAGQLAYLNVKLTESEEKLQDLNANKDKFFSIISHDLKSPFTCLMGFSDFLLNDIDEMEKTEIKEFVQSINSSAKGVFKLLQNLLEWSRIQTNNIEFLPGLFNLSELIKGLKDIYLANFIQKNITLVTNIDDDIKAFADKNMIETVLRNLISNAIKFTPNGMKIYITAKRDEELIYVSVRDEGVGISEANMKKLFRIDEHLTTDGTNAEKGTGLGLILCKDFISKNGGEIQVKSEINKGSEFYFNLQTENIFSK
jgi:PAS domain S-box-containing protein